MIGLFIQKEKHQALESISNFIFIFFFLFIFIFRKIKDLQANATRSTINKTNNDVCLFIIYLREFF
jgi:hypothetical protein